MQSRSKSRPINNQQLLNCLNAIAIESSRWNTWIKRAAELARLAKFRSSLSWETFSSSSTLVISLVLAPRKDTWLVNIQQHYSDQNVSWNLWMIVSATRKDRKRSYLMFSGIIHGNGIMRSCQLSNLSLLPLSNFRIGLLIRLVLEEFEFGFDKLGFGDWIYRRCILYLV